MGRARGSSGRGGAREHGILAAREDAVAKDGGRWLRLDMDLRRGE
jgi:hypothetical protein